ncbi:MAG: hypothetical protein ABI923_03770, partial [bacterium]
HRLRVSAGYTDYTDRSYKTYRPYFGSILRMSFQKPKRQPGGVGLPFWLLQPASKRGAHQQLRGETFCG